MGFWERRLGLREGTVGLDCMVCDAGVGVDSLLVNYERKSEDHGIKDGKWYCG